MEDARWRDGSGEGWRMKRLKDGEGRLIIYKAGA